jgi:hypothetical protein
LSRKTTTTTICDSGHCQEVPAEVTRQFEVDGKAWALDLCGSCSAGLDAVLASVLKHARPVKVPRPYRLPSERPGRNRARSAAIRAWARDEGIEIAEKGRIPASVISQYDAKAA